MGFMDEARSSSSLATKGIAAIVLLIAAWILVKVVIGFVSAIFWTVLVIAAVLAVIWAFFTLRS
jgi:fatty acid desaturase